MNDIELVRHLHNDSNDLRKELAKVIVGQESIIDQLLIALFSGGHCLLVGVPGLAKTLLIKTLAQALNLSFNRIQFTPDLMPSDITGTEILEDNRSTGEKFFRFIKGPIFSNIVLADEINRTPPKTQSALLEAMQEHNVTAAGNTYKLDKPFFVLATQNPIEQEGTYPLPEAQLDRFMFSLKVDYPSFDEEVRIVAQTTNAATQEVERILNADKILMAQELVRKVPVAENVIRFAVKLTTTTRPNIESASEFVNNYLRYGAGPRASQYLVLGAKARAVLQGRFSPEIEDVKAVSLAVLRHRIVTNFNAEAEGISQEDIIKKLIASVSN